MDFTTNEEIWKDVKGYEGRYQVSDKGRVKSLQRTSDRLSISGKPSSTTVNEKILKPTLNVGVTGGYPTVKLMIDNKGVTKKVHRLVAEAFLNNPENLSDVNHIDENKENNDLINLEWSSRRDNNEHGTRKERIYSHPNYLKTMKEFGERRSKAVKGTNIKTGEVVIYKSTLAAEKDGFRNSNISSVCLGKRKTHKGFMWEYI